MLVGKEKEEKCKRGRKKRSLWYEKAGERRGSSLGSLLQI